VTLGTAQHTRVELDRYQAGGTPDLARSVETRRGASSCDKLNAPVRHRRTLSVLKSSDVFSYFEEQSTYLTTFNERVLSVRLSEVRPCFDYLG
jgi:hypothetical protein